MNCSPIQPVIGDQRSFIIQGRRRILICGEIHYSRVPREQWGAILDRTVELGVNTLAVYVFWNFHEEKRDVFDFSGDRDLVHFLQLCHERGLLVILRTGPYCCGEWNYGGFPAWLREEEGVVFRTWNKAFMERVEKYFKHLYAEFIPQLTTNGGPVAMVQVENEYMNIAKWYGEDGERYVQWMVDLARELGVDVPLITCEGGVPGAIECLNGFSIPEERIQKLRARQPDLPVVWTELWPGWYDTWGAARHHRDARNIAAAILEFISRGGSGFNYYMWFGGTNLGRTAMYLQCTDYGFDGPLDEFGQPTRKGLYLRALHRALTACESVLLEGEVSVTKEGESEIHEFRLDGKRVAITAQSQSAVYGADGVLLPQARILFDGEVLFDSLSDWDACNPPVLPWNTAAGLTLTGRCPEPMPVDRSDEPVRSEMPVEQLLLTTDRSDYCWYTTNVEFKANGTHQLRIPFGADFLYCFVDGRYCGVTKTPLREWRGPTLRQPDRKQSASAMAEQEWANEAEQFIPDGFLHEFAFEAGPGPHRIDLLATAIGLIKGDWSIAGPMHTERKGIWDEVFLDGQQLTGWEMRPFLRGEKNPMAWAEGGDPAARLQWHRFGLQLNGSERGDFRLDLGGWGKGMAFVNGRMIGRYWLLEGNGYGPDAIWHPKNAGLYAGPDGEPTQRYYLVPRSWLKAGENEVVLFEEQTPGAGIQLQQRNQG